MALIHAKSGELINIRPLGDALLATRPHTLVLSPTLEVFLLVLPAHKHIPVHEVAGALTIQCLEGKVEVEAHGVAQTMSAGTLVYLEPHAPHALTAITDTSVLVSLLRVHQ